ncbi:uncharacterized protein L201_003925 [Kwoniella dendrophila CBS 6074]|uniref:Alpha/beta hydrolase fold-3 domain-containing protein n=1 Tax=Kwoniella dendrophila CBS 6074 TaxID=1295534 RepID=A0AAX4JWV7_9TREE
MPDLLTPQALAAAGPLVLETLFKHFLGPRPKDDKGKAKDDLMYEEAFVLMRTFLEMATKYPVAALQRFGQVRTPSPPWVGVFRVSIPRSSLNDAANYLIEGFGGEEMAYKIAGGTKWWQVRAGLGVEGEWIVMKKDWKGVVAEEKKEHKKRAQEGVLEEEEENEFRPEMDRLRCMLYIHGGAYYWGSINTHRYTIWRYARKMHGRCFAVNYRKAPQYPFPCAIQDCLAAYLYLTNPPPEAKHRPVDPKSIILAGDSAGGGLCLALLQILRDTPGLELPAGAVLISPWSDLTHSFPSILQNTATDIVPPYGFIHKPSSLWPPPPPMLTEEVQTRLRSRVKEAVHRMQHRPQKAEEDAKSLLTTIKQEAGTSTINEPTTVPDKLKTSKPAEGLEKSKDQSESDLHPLADKSENKHPEPQTEPTHNPSRANPADLFPALVEQREKDIRPSTLAQCDTPLKLTVKGEEILIDTQIQLYATNAQLCHPWVSPVLGYLGGLPPLFVMCGDKEVLRDEIIFLAHKAANPDEHPIRDDVKVLLPSLNGIEDKYAATNVHLQVYDGVCHDLPLLSMTRPSRGAFRAIASFARYVTPSAPGSKYIRRSYPVTPKDSKSGTPRGSTSKGTPEADSSILGAQYVVEPDNNGTSSPITTEQKIIEDVLTGTPAIMTPAESSSSAADKAKKKTPILNLNLGEEVSTTTSSGLDSPVKVRPKPHKEDSRDTLDVTLSHTPSRNVSFASSFNSSSASSDHKPERRQSILPPSPNSRNGSGTGFDGASASRSNDPTRGNTQPSGDESGPRFEDSETFMNDWNATEGEAGWAGIYKGIDPFTNHMIRERVSITGELRPLEPKEDLQAMQMPLDEVGYIKEGPAMRYINGQALWDKKYHRAAKHVKKRREKNLKIAQKEGHKIGMEWLRKARETRDTQKDKLESNGQENGKDDEKNIDKTLSTSWNWALNGEAPPPSAIISRRDFAEARQLALMADRLDSSHDTSFHGLSIWVGLATFFSSSSERNKASEALKVAREAKKVQKTKGTSSKSKNSSNRDIWTDLDDDDDDHDESGTNTPSNGIDNIHSESDANIDNQEGVIGKHGVLIKRITSKSSQFQNTKSGFRKALEGKKERKKKGVVANWFGILGKKQD